MSDKLTHWARRSPGDSEDVEQLLRDPNYEVRRPQDITLGVEARYGTFETARANMADALCAIATRTDPPQNARIFFRGPHVTSDIAEAILEYRGEPARHLSHFEKITRALHTTSDFPNILGDVFNKNLREFYAATPSGLLALARKRFAASFLPQKSVVLSEGPALAQVLEGGTFKRGSFRDGGETYQLSVYGRVFSVSRRAMVNDDLRVFAQAPTLLATAARELQNGLLASTLTANAVMADGQQLFSAAHANTSTGAAISATSLGVAFAAIRAQRGPNGELIGASPRFLVVPAAKEAEGLQALASLAPAMGGDSKVTLIVDSHLDATSTSQWYVVADPQQIGGLEALYLQGSPPFHVQVQPAFEQDGLEILARLDFAAAAVDYRGLHRNG